MASPTVSVTTQPDPEFADGIYAIDCDSAAHKRDGAVTLLSDNSYRIGGWSHVTSQGSFSTTRQPPRDYRIDVANYLPDATCADYRTVTVLLAKKTYDWDRQHANGIETSFATEGVAFGDVTDISIELRINSDRTYIPGADELAEAYGDLLSPEQLAELDGGMVNLELTLFGEGATEDQPFMNASVIVSIDPAEFADQWIRVQIPRDQFTFYTENNYVRTEVSSGEYQDLLVRGFRLNPETPGRLTVRHFVGDAFVTTAKPELFKEMDITIALIEVGHD